MPNIESKKGQGCPYKSITCQEGYCQDCQAYLNFRNRRAYSDYKDEKPLRAKLKQGTSGSVYRIVPPPLHEKVKLLR